MKEQFKLIQGTFTPAEAADVMLSLLNDKIRFHSLKMMNLKDETNNISESRKRLEELKSFKRRVEQMLMAAHHNYMELEINGDIHLRMVKPETQSDEIDISKTQISQSI